MINPPSRDPNEAAIDELRALHAEVDREVEPLAGRHTERLHCGRGCSACCVDELTVFEVEAENIRRHHADLLERGEPREPGACAFLDHEGACRVYEHRPYVCRTQGLPLAWFLEREDGEIEQHRDICPENADGEPLESLELEECWLIGPRELAIARIQDRYGDAEKRVALRSLFHRRDSSPPSSSS